MSWQDEARVNGYVAAALRANNDAELARGMQATDDAVDLVDRGLNAAGDVIKDIFSSPEPPPPPKSSGGGLGGLLALGALAGGAYLLSKVFGSDDKPKSTDSSNNSSSKNI